MLPTKLKDYFTETVTPGAAYPPDDELMVLLYKAIIQVATWLDEDSGVTKSDHVESIENIDINS